MTGELTLSSATPGGALSAVPKTYVDSNLATKQGALGYTPVNKAGDTGVGPLALAADPVSALQVTTKQYVDAAVTPKANLAGATFTGSVILQADPVVALGAATKQYVDTQANVSMPAGAIMAFYRSTAPTGWLECNGQSAASYPNLVALGITNVPDLRGQFVRGWDNGKGIDPGRTLASLQADEFKSHSHSTYSRASSYSGAVGVSDGILGSSNTGSTGGTETRPKNIALMYCIKT
jgi:phage-related tail fiber protein